MPKSAPQSTPAPAPEHIRVIETLNDDLSKSYTIANPIMVGAVINYKATALALAEQLYTANAQSERLAATIRQHANQSRTIDSLYHERDRTNAAIASAMSHWSTMFWPKSLWSQFKSAGLSV